MTIRRLASVSVLGLTMLTVASAPAVAANSKRVQVISVRALPTLEQMHTGQGALSRQSLNRVRTSSALAFQVKLRNDGATERTALVRR